MADIEIGNVLIPVARAPLIQSKQRAVGKRLSALAIAMSRAVCFDHCVKWSEFQGVLCACMHCGVY